MRGQCQNIENYHGKGQPERMCYKSRFIKNKSEQSAENNQAGAQAPAAAHFHAQKQDHGCCADEKEGDQLRQVGYLRLSPVLQKTLDDIGLDLHTVHLGTLVNGCEIGILQSRRTGTDEHDLAGPVIGGNLSADQHGDRDPVVVITRAHCEGNVKMARFTDFGKLQLLSLLFQKAACRFAGHGIHPALFGSVGLHVQKSVPHDTVDIHHGIDMSLPCAAAQGFKGLLIGQYRRGAHRRCPSVLPGDLLPELSHTGRDHIAEISGCFCKAVICLLCAVSRIKDINGSDSRLFIGIRSKRLQGGSHNIAVPGVIGSQELQCVFIDPDDNNIPGRGPRALKEPVLRPSVHASEHTQTDQTGDQQSRGNGKDIFFE